MALNPDSLGPSPVDVSVLLAFAWATALVFVLTGRRFGREPPGRAMFGYPPFAAWHEAEAADHAAPWTPPALPPAAAAEREEGVGFSQPGGCPAKREKGVSAARVDTLYTNTGHPRRTWRKHALWPLFIVGKQVVAL